MQELAKRHSEVAAKVHELLSYLYPGFDEDLANYPNVEDFLNLVEMAKEFHTEAYIESKRWSQKKSYKRQQTPRCERSPNTSGALWPTIAEGKFYQPGLTRWCVLVTLLSASIGTS
jgi:hypothetical protein